MMGRGRDAEAALTGRLDTSFLTPDGAEVAYGVRHFPWHGGQLRGRQRLGTARRRRGVVKCGHEPGDACASAGRHRHSNFMIA